MIEPRVQWVAPAPLWPGLAGANDTMAFQQPAILRFATDSFMQDLLAMLDSAPARIGEFLARPETWRKPQPPPAPTEPQSPGERALARLLRAAQPKLPGPEPVEASQVSPAPPLKLYQPAHQRHYLVTACLTCRLPGLPDRLLNSATQERVTFVVRRLRPRVNDPHIYDEYAFVTTGRPTWQPVSHLDALMPGEEQTALFPMNFPADDGRQRRLFAGLIPVAKRETYLGAPVQTPSADPTATPSAAALPADPRTTLLQTQVSGPWKNLIERAAAIQKQLADSQGANPGPSPTDKRQVLKAGREQIQTVSWYVLLDLAKYLADYLPNVWAALTGPPLHPLTPAESHLVTVLGQTAITAGLVSDLTLPEPPAYRLVYNPADVPGNLATALVRISADGVGTKLESATSSYDRGNPAAAVWPSILFPLADPTLLVPNPPGTRGVLDAAIAAVTALETAITAALPDDTRQPGLPLPLAAQPVADAGDGQFIIRCLFERPGCGPTTPALRALPGPALPAPVVISAPTQVFKMATFFDPEAPARPIRITLPKDTTPAGLRKYDKNTAFMISDTLCNQLNGLGGVTLGDLVLSVLPWPFHKDLNLSGGGSGDCDPDGGMVCNFSIPIITICAMIVLMIFIKLFDIIFFWMPFFRICFPLPKFNAKEEE